MILSSIACLVNTGSSFQTEKGELLFGGINGYTSFYPEGVRDNITIPHSPEVQILEHEKVKLLLDELDNEY